MNKDKREVKHNTEISSRSVWENAVAEEEIETSGEDFTCGRDDEFTLRHVEDHMRC